MMTFACEVNPMPEPVRQSRFHCVGGTDLDCLTGPGKGSAQAIELASDARSA